MGHASGDQEFPAIQRGDKRAFARWMASVEHPLRLSLRSFAADVDTEAILQEAFLKTWLAAPSARPAPGGSTLLRLASRIARNLAIDWVRRTRLGYSESEYPDVAVVPVATDPFLRDAIRRCAEELPTQPARAIQARVDRAGDNDRAIAAELGMSLNTFLQNIVRARRALAICLERHGVEVPR